MVGNRQMKKNKILLLLRESIFFKSSSNILFSRLVDKFSDNELIIISIGSSYFNKKNRFKRKRTIIFYDLLSINRFIRYFLKHNFSNLYWKNLFKLNKNIMKKILKTIEKENVNKLWVYIDYRIIKYARVIKERLKIPVHLTIFDDPLDNSVTRKLLKYFENDFRFLLNNHTSCDIVSIQMKEYYKKFGCNLRNPFVSYGGFALKQPNKKNKISKRCTSICFAGNPWALNNIIKFAKVVEKFNNSNKHKFQLYFYTQHTIKELQKLKCITWLKYLNEEDVVDEIAQYDLAYIPMSLLEKDRTKAKISFPGKLTNTIQAGLPIICHARYTP